MSNAIRRLSESKVQVEKLEHDNGVEAGRCWVDQSADYSEVRNLSDWWDSTSEYDRELQLTTLETDAFGASHLLACVIRGNDKCDRRDSDEFWDSAIGESNQQRNSDQFVRGFAEGAYEVWNQLKERI